MAEGAAPNAAGFAPSMAERPEQLPFHAADYELLAEVGVGAFAAVYSARCLTNNEVVAVKIIDLEQLDIDWDSITRETHIMKMMRHPNIVPILSAFVEADELWMVMPLMEVGSCSRVIKYMHPKGIKDDEIVATILFEVLKALAYIHKDGKIHRDIKAGNVLISSSGQIQLADFGVAGALVEQGDRQKNRKTFIGTPCWMAPEVMDQAGGYDYKADIWSFGILAMELAYGRAPYSNLQPMKILMNTINQDPPTCDIYQDKSHKFSKKLYKLIAQCLQKDPKLRPSADRLMQHKYFAKYLRGPQVIVERIVAKMPKPPAPNGPPRASKKEQGWKPVTVASFSHIDLDDLKLQLRADAEEIEQRRRASDADLQQPRLPAVADEDDFVDGAGAPVPNQQAGDAATAHMRRGSNSSDDASPRPKRQASSPAAGVNRELPPHRKQVSAPDLSSAAVPKNLSLDASSYRLIMSIKPTPNKLMAQASDERLENIAVCIYM